MKLRLILPVFAGALAITACATDGTRPHPDETTALVDQVFKTPKTDPDGLINRAINEHRLKQDAEIAELERRIDELSHERARAGRAPGAPRVGLAMRASAGGEGARRLAASLQRNAPGYPVTLAAPDEVADRLAAENCKQPLDAACLSALAEYPGVQLVVQLDAAKLAGEARAKVSIYDTLLGSAYGTIELQSPDDSLDGLTDAIYQTAADRADTTPWHTRSFRRDGEQWYISAGQDSGLQQGDRLSVHADGRIVPSPTGKPAGWIADEATGTVEIVSFFGDDLAVAKLVEGKGPEAGDVLLWLGR